MIYFIQEGKNGSLKIGYSRNNIKRRLSQFQVSSSRDLYLLCFIDGDIGMEKRIHNTFHSIKDRGEWFHPYPHLIEYIKYLKEEKMKIVEGRRAS